MNMKEQGALIGEKYKVLKAFPFVIGTLYFVEMKMEEGTHRTCFLHALNASAISGELDLERIRKRDEYVFFPVREAFVDEDVLYQVFRRLEGVLLGHHLQEKGPLSLKAVTEIARGLLHHLLRLDEEGQFTIIHPQNVVMIQGKSLRFLYGGELGLLPKMAGMIPFGGTDLRAVSQSYDSYTLGVLIYQMLTRKNPIGQGLTIPPIRDFAPDCPPELDHLVKQSFSFDLEKRPTISEWMDYFDWLAERLELNWGRKR